MKALSTEFISRNQSFVGQDITQLQPLWKAFQKKKTKLSK